MVTEVFVTTKRGLADVRAELRLSQDALVKAARISKQVIVNAEKGLTIQRISAYAILKALNKRRAEEGMLPLKIDDIDWHIKGST